MKITIEKATAAEALAKADAAMIDHFKTTLENFAEVLIGRGATLSEIRAELAHYSEVVRLEWAKQRAELERWLLRGGETLH